ncbi:MAG: hypothetical protein SGI88_00660 [Candidatus Hydrogenedentes bacterium]|nr:hypothetical protein [Candidatus Hydrogenedentota bacterium]
MRKLLSGSATTILAISACGCFAGDRLVIYPPLRVEGKLSNSVGQPVAGRAVLLARTSLANEDVALADALNGTLGDGKPGSTLLRGNTTSDGVFRFDFSGSTSLQTGGMIGFVPVGPPIRKDIHFILTTGHESSIYRIRIHNRRLNIVRLRASLHDLEPVNDERLIFGTAKRTTAEDMITLTLMDQ